MSNPPTAYTIDHEGLQLDIALVLTDRLLIHEETIPHHLIDLENSIRCDGVQSAPILVDRQTGVVLDGMHRTAVMHHLGCRFTCACYLDYFNPSIKMQRWCRIIKGEFTPEKALNMLETHCISLTPMEEQGDPEEEDALLLVFKDSTYKADAETLDLLETFTKINQFEDKLNASGYTVNHGTETEAYKMVQSGEYAAAIYPPKIKKKQVIEVAQRHQVFTPKSTRHRLPARPVQVNAPLELLKDKEISIEEANRKLFDVLKDKKYTRYDPGAKWCGRVYDEVLYVFSDA